MTHNQIAEKILDAAMYIHRKLGPGLLESVYLEILFYELRKMGLKVQKELPLPVVWESIKLDIGFRADLLVEDKVIVELKSLERTAPVHKKQVLTYLRVADKRLGLLLNFGEALLRDGIHRIVNGLNE